VAVMPGWEADMLPGYREPTNSSTTFDQRPLAAQRCSKHISQTLSFGAWDVKTTLTVYAYLVNTDDPACNIAAPGALAPRRSRATATPSRCTGRR
jgi:hypothetical protein